MKRLFFIVAVAVSVLFVSAADASAQFKIGFGYSLADNIQRSKIGDNDPDRDTYHGFLVNAVYDWEFLYGSWGNFGMMTGLNYEYLTDGQRTKLKNFNARILLEEHYIDIPVMFKYGYDCVPGIVGVYVMAGPTFSFGVASRTEWYVSGKEGKNEIDGNIKYNNYTGKVTSNRVPDYIVPLTQGMTDYGWFDVKLGIGAGIDLFDAVEIKFGYNWGLVNRYKGDTAKIIDRKSNQFYLTLSYCFM